MADTDGLSILLCSCGDLRDSSISIGVATPLEHSSLVVDNVNVDILSDWHHSNSGIDRVLVLVHEDGIIQSVGTLLIATKIICVQEIGLP